MGKEDDRLNVYQMSALAIFENPDAWFQSLDAKRKVAALLWRETGNEQLAEYLFAPLFTDKPSESLNVASFVGRQNLKLVGAQFGHV